MSDFDLDRFGDAPRIAVVVRDHMSGVLYSVPSLRAIRKRWPNAHITLLTSSYSAPIIDGACSYLDRVLPLYTFSDTPGRYDKVKDYARKATTWARMVGRVDLVIHLRHTGGMSILACALMGKPAQVAYTQDKFNNLLAHDCGPEDVVLGSRQRNQIILESIGIEPDGYEMELDLRPGDKRWAAEWLTANGYEPGDHLTIVHPGSHWGCNQWLPERWTDAIQKVLAERGGIVALTGVERELPLAERIAGDLDDRRVVNAVGKTDLRQYAALIGASDLVLAIDAAPTQICQALDIPAVIMMGAGNPAWNGPVPGERMLMLQEWDNDNPRPEVCQWWDGACNGPLCQSRLEDITVTQVLESVEDLVNRPTG